MRYLSAIATGALVFLALPNDAAAQDFMGMANANNAAMISMTGNMALQASAKKKWGVPNCWADDCRSLRKGRSTARQYRQSLQALTAQPDFPDLDLSYSPQVSDKVRNKIYAELSKYSRTEADEYRQVSQKYDLKDIFDGIVRPYGLSSDDLADSIAAYWILNWMIANQNENVSKDKAQAVRSQILARIDQTPALQGASAADRQEVAETLIHQFVIQQGAWATAVRQNDRAMLQKMAVAARQGMNKVGVDIAALKLTDIGFSKE